MSNSSFSNSNETDSKHSSNTDQQNPFSSTKTIEKTRYAVPFNDFIIEIDVFDFWSDRAFAEIELKSEDEQFVLPDFIKVIKEVTFDKRYRNSALSRKIVRDEII